MNISTIIIGLSSIGFILIGLFILFNKAISKSLTTENNKLEVTKFIRKCSSTNIITGIVGGIIATVDFFVDNNTYIVILFIVVIGISTIIQLKLKNAFINKLIDN